MKLIILSDIHANLSALENVFKDIASKNIEEHKLVILGDVINYGLRPNETLELIKKKKNILVLLAGNHEMALMGHEDDRFSSPRGKEILDQTKKILSNDNYEFIKNNFLQTFHEIEIDGKLILFIHGSIEDKFWGTIDASNKKSEKYKKYDVVFSGHSHIPHFVEHFFEVNNPKMRNKKKTIFINPGSIGQPRNHDNRAQYSIFDTVNMDMSFYKCKYNIEEEQKIFEKYDVDDFYRTRLGEGV